MSWNYRIVEHTRVFKKFITNTELENERRNYLDVREVYYDENGNPDSMTEESISPSGSTLDDLLESWELYKKAFEKDILIYDWDKEKFVDRIPDG